MLRTYDAQGRPTLELTSTTVKFAGVATVGWNYTGAAQSGSINDSRLVQYPGCVPYVIVISGQIDVGGYLPQFSINGATITWTYRMANAQTYTRPDTTFVYGIF
jgi:hypothetical protein